MEVSVSDKGVLLFNQALIHMRVRRNINLSWFATV